MMLFPPDINKRAISSNRKQNTMESASQNHNYKKNEQHIFDSYYNGNVPTLLMFNQLKNSVENALQNLNLDTAVFLSELLYAECGGLQITNMSRIESVYLYSLSLYLIHDYKTAMAVSDRLKNIHVGIGFIYGRCAEKLSTNEESACLYLVMRLPDYQKDLENGFYYMPNLATIHCLIGKLYNSFHNMKASINHHIEALKLDPYLWESYTALFNKKVDIDLKTIFFGFNENAGLYHRNNNNNASNNNSNNSNDIDSQNVFVGSNTKEHFSRLNRHGNSRTQYSRMDKGTFNNGKMNINNEMKQNINPVDRKLYAFSNYVTNNPMTTSPTVKQPTISSLAKMNNKNRNITTPPPKSNGNDPKSKFKTPRNISNSNTMLNSSIRKKLNIRDSNNRILGVPKANQDLNKFQSNILEETSLYSSTDNASSENPFKELFYTFAKVLKLSSKFNSHNCIRVMDKHIPSHILNNMPWCQAQLGKLHYEISNYEMSLKYFQNLRQIQPTRVVDLEIFSTLLWHLKDNYSLFVLSDKLVEEFADTSEAWCVTGNYFSLMKNHDEAIKAFERAIELDPKFAYAYTLQGHEYVANESYDNAKILYRKAIACDPQHYNAYYGLGDCSSRLGNYEEALLYFEKARMINPVNAIIICCCGHALEKMALQERALDYYDLACNLQPDLILPKYKKAQLLFSMGRLTVAMEYFEALTKLSPDEATVHFMLGQIYQTMGRKKDAINEYTVALTLDPLGNQVILDALEKCHMQE